MVKVYTRVTADRLLDEWSQKDERDYKLFCEYVWKSDGGHLLLEFSFNNEVKEKIQFIKQFARETGFRPKDLLTLFMDKTVFKLFQIIGWDFRNLFNLMKKGFNVYKNIQSVITDFTTNNKIEWDKNTIIELNRYLKTSPKTKRISNDSVVGLLIYLWLEMSSIKNNLSIDGLALVLFGNYNLHSFFGTPTGSKILLLFTDRRLNNLGFSWQSNDLIKFETKVLITIANYFHKRLNKGNDSDQFEINEVYKRAYV